MNKGNFLYNHIISENLCLFPTKYRREEFQNTTCCSVPMSIDEVTELTWENGHLAFHGFSGINPHETKCRTENTLESLVHQAASLNKFPEHTRSEIKPTQIWRENSNDRSVSAMSGGKWRENSGKKRVRSESDRSENASASPSVGFCPTNDTAMMSNWTSFGSSLQSFKRTKNIDEDTTNIQDCSENQNGSFRSQSSTRRGHAAAIHNQSERRRRDRINEKMKALQKLVPNANKTDKASMLDEVIDYLKQLQAQVQMMCNVRNMPQVVMPPLAMQQLHMSLLARSMGMGVMNMPQSLPQALHGSGGPTPQFANFGMPRPPPFLPPKNINSFSPGFSNDAYSTFLAQQSINMDLFNKMAAMYQGQTNQTFENFSQPNNVQRE